MIVDAHVHVGTWDHPDFLGRGCTLDETLAELEGAGAQGAVLMPTDRGEIDDLAAGVRRALAGGYRGALWLVPWIEPERGDLAWVRAHREVVSGLKIHPSLSRRRITDPAFREALALAEEEGLVVIVHCGRWQEMASYRFALDAAAAHPGARFLLAHAGGDTPPLATAAAEQVAERGLRNVWFDFAGLREYWVVERNVEILGAERYLMGSDYALAHPAMYIGAVRAMKLSDADKRRILGENARELFGAPRSEGA